MINDGGLEPSYHTEKIETEKARQIKLRKDAGGKFSKRVLKEAFRRRFSNNNVYTLKHILFNRYFFSQFFYWRLNFAPNLNFSFFLIRLRCRTRRLWSNEHSASSFIQHEQHCSHFQFITCPWHVFRSWHSYSCTLP